MEVIRLGADTSQAVKEVNNLGDSLEELHRKLKVAQDNKNWSEAAKIAQEITRVQSPISSAASGGNQGNSILANAFNQNSAKQLDIRLETITRVISVLTDQLKEATEKGLSKESYNISAALNSVEQEKRQLEAEKKRLESAEKIDTSTMEMIKKYGVGRYFEQGLNYVNQLTGIGFNHRIAMANGDYLGADVSAVESEAGIAQGLGGSMLGAGMMLGATPVGWGLMAAGGIAELGGAIAKYWAGDARADIAEGEAYRKTLSGTNALNKLFSDGGTWEENSEKTTELLKEGTRLAEGTGLSTADFLALAAQQSQYGAETRGDALQQVRSVALWAQATGADARAIQEFLGTARRYGDNSDVLGYASQARQAAGLAKAQSEEFLNALQSVIEAGIANGYIKSAEDVSKTMVMVARLSDNNPLWQGEQGARRLQQMDSGISGATALQSVSDVIVAGAANTILSGKTIDERNKLLDGRATGTYIDSMLLMEKGTNPAMFAEVAKSIQDIEGENIAGQIERYKDVYKLNYAGAVDVYNMALKMRNGNMTEETFSEAISAMQQDKQYQSEEVKWQNNINEIDKNVALMAQSKFWENLNKLESIAEESKIYSPIDVYAKTVASTPEIAGEVSKEVKEDLSNYDLTATDITIKNNLTTELMAASLANKNDYIGATKAFLYGEKGLSLANMNGWQNTEDSFFGRLYNSGIGNDRLDDKIIEMFSVYAANGNKLNNKGKIIREADGVVDEGEVVQLINALDSFKGRKVKKAYENNDEATFLAELRKLLTELFGNLTISVE